MCYTYFISSIRLGNTPEAYKERGRQIRPKNQEQMNIRQSLKRNRLGGQSGKVKRPEGKNELDPET